MRVSSSGASSAARTRLSRPAMTGCLAVTITFHRAGRDTNVKSDRRLGLEEKIVRFVRHARHSPAFVTQPEQSGRNTTPASRSLLFDFGCPDADR